ncbi:hypothetical protein FQN51_000404, partial [Onygenales sp. PD_10]
QKKAYNYVSYDFLWRMMRHVGLLKYRGANQPTTTSFAFYYTEGERMPVAIVPWSHGPELSPQYPRVDMSPASISPPTGIRDKKHLWSPTKMPRLWGQSEERVMAKS